MKRILLYFTIALTGILAGCAPTYRSEFQKRCKNKNYNDDQCLAAEYFSYRTAFAKENTAKNGYEVLYPILAKTEVRKRLDKAVSDLNEVLNYKDKELAKYIDNFGLRKDLEHDEQVFKAIRSFVRAAELADQFNEMMGVTSHGDAAMIEAHATYGVNLRQGYNARQVFPEDLLKATPFVYDLIEQAKAKGTLKKVEDFVLYADQTYAKKEPDLNDPSDNNKFVWVSKKAGLKLAGYKIVDVPKPDDSKVNYVEGTRIWLTQDKNGNFSVKEESRPALKFFMTSGGYSGVLLLDVDLEGQDNGFGLPDIVEKVSGVYSAKDFANDRILAQLYPDEKKTQRTKPVPPVIGIEIAKANKIDLWEKALDANGWTVPFKYKNERGDNYNIKLKMAKPDMSSMTGPSHDMPRKIEYFKKEYTGPDRYSPSVGAVEEWYKPKPPFDGELTSAEVLHGQDTKKISIVRSDGSEENGTITPKVNKFIADKPYTVVYTEGQKRWILVDEDGDGKFEKRKETSIIKGTVGEYPMGSSQENHEEHR